MNREPQKATHTIRTDTVNIDSSVKRLELDFCKSDAWSDCWPGMMNIAEMFQAGVNIMVSQDSHSVGSQQTIINKDTCAPVEMLSFMPNIVKPEYIVQK